MNEEENELVIQDDENNESIQVEEQENNSYTVENVTNNDERDSIQESTKIYKQEDVDKILEARTNSLNRKHQKELNKYQRIGNTLKKAMKLDSIEDVSKQLDQFYKEQGIELSDNMDSFRDEREEKILAKADADEVISLGEVEMKRRANELAQVKRNAREQEEFMIICNNLVKIEARRELKEKGVDDSIIDSEDFKKFASKFNYDTKLSDIYDIYAKNKGIRKKQPDTLGSLRNNLNVSGNEVKDFYTPEEAKKFTVKDFDRNPELFKAVEKSAEKW